ncbi:hypothetical protein GON26_12290 [Flavobacterium sp. GA093]|uniref:Uncharacterized protein n=1 Tax=Flavobacterium hydrocarbonoxydans TaxID=2683249 RepID=A0A6I4NQB1_9FLAO|nr:hypothetical protein [Flavobacterium hydrocarbonoxydans]MWB95142.1 hypothetical protein [Flavobacterium hydrocarbonoxydans]
MSLKGLIENQTIIIDDHKRGSREIKNWDSESNDVHIDKTTNFPVDGKRQKIRIRVPINSSRPIKIENQKKDNLKQIPKQLEREIKKAFENTGKRREFILEIIDILKDFETSLNNEDRAKQILENLSNHFGLKWTGEKITTYVEEVLMAYTEVFEDKRGGNFFMKIDREKIEIGENSGYAKQFGKINRK